MPPKKSAKKPAEKPLDKPAKGPPDKPTRKPPDKLPGQGFSEPPVEGEGRRRPEKHQNLGFGPIDLAEMPIDLAEGPVDLRNGNAADIEGRMSLDSGPIDLRHENSRSENAADVEGRMNLAEGPIDLRNEMLENREAEQGGLVEENRNLIGNEWIDFVEDGDVRNDIDNELRNIENERAGPNEIRRMMINERDLNCLTKYSRLSILSDSREPKIFG